MKSFLVLVAVTVSLAVTTLQADTFVRIDTDFGPIHVQLFDSQTPLTVANFLHYLDAGQYAPSVFHRYVSNFVWQGGGYTIANNNLVPVTTIAPVQNEPGISNQRGTLAMAKVGGDPNSATSQFFINIADNSQNLDNQNGGFTVFGKVLSGMSALDDMANYTYFPYQSSGYPEWPAYQYYDSNNNVQTSLYWFDVVRQVQGDANDDGKVDVLDLGMLATNWNKSANWSGGDFNGDGFVDVLDLGILATHWQSSAGSFADAAASVGLTVPEPASLSLLALAATALIRRRK